MTISGAISDLNNLLKADNIPSYYKPSIQKIIETIELEQSNSDLKYYPPCEDCHAKMDEIRRAYDRMQSNSDYPKCNTCIHKNEDVICYGCVDNDEYVSNSDTDCISREKVINEIMCWIGSGEYRYTNATDYLIKRINDLPSVQPKEVYNKGWKDGAEATAYHVELCEEENPTISLSVIEDIKTEIVNTVCEERNHCDGDLGFLKWCAGLGAALDIIDKHISGKER